MIWLLIIPLIVVGLYCAAMLGEFLMHDREKAKEIKLGVSRRQRQIKQLQKEGKTQEMMAVQKELFGLMGKQMRLSFKPMLISFPLFLVVFMLLSGMLAYQPIYVGQDAQVGLYVKNTDSVQHELVAQMLPGSGLELIGGANKTVSLSKNGVAGDNDVLWWTIKSASEGDKDYDVAVSLDGGDPMSKSLSLKVVTDDALGYQFSPDTSVDRVSGVEVQGKYKNLVLFNVAGFDFTWFWFYLMSYFIIAALMSPVKNKFLWGHWRGLKHIEKVEMEKEKNEQTVKE